MMRLLSRTRPSWWLGAALLACSAGPAASPSGQVIREAAPQASVAAQQPGQEEAGDRRTGDAATQVPAQDPRPRGCHESAAGRDPASAGYRFELDGAAIVPDIVSLAGAATPRAGDIVRVGMISMVLGPPGSYQYFTDPARPDDLELSFDGGPRRLVAVHVTDADLRPAAELGHLRGLVLRRWNESIAATVARLAGDALFIEYDASRRLFRSDAPLVPAELPADLGYLRVVSAGMSQPGSTTGLLSLAGLERLPGLRYLAIDVRSLSADGPDTIDAAALARLSALERLDLRRALALKDPGSLGALERLHALDLALHEEIDDLAFVTGLRGLRWLDLRGTRVVSLEPLARHPGLQVVVADDTPLTTLPATPPPALRELSVMATSLSDADVERFAALAPAVWIRHRRNPALAGVAACATRLRVRTGGLCHRRREDERTLFQRDDPDAVRELLPLLRVDEAADDFHCMCCGSLTFELRHGEALVAELGFHHGRSLRWSGWPTDGLLSDPDGLCTWLERHGAPDACAERRGAADK